MQSETDRIRAAQKGDGAAFEDLVRSHARLVWATVSGMIRDPSWTEDLVQETFLRAWKSIGQLNEPTAFRSWLLSIARRLVFRHTELSGRPLTEAPRTQDSEVPNEAVHDAIKRLPERYRLPITLRYLNEMNYARISRDLNLTNGALRGLLNRGVKLLREELEPLWKEQGS